MASTLCGCTSTVLHVCSGVSWLYEDDGNTTKYMIGKMANTTISYVMDTSQYDCSDVIVVLLWSLL